MTGASPSHQETSISSVNIAVRHGHVFYLFLMVSLANRWIMCGHFESWRKFLGQSPRSTLWGVLVFTMNMFGLFQVGAAQPPLCRSMPSQMNSASPWQSTRKMTQLFLIFCVWGKQEQSKCPTISSHVALFQELFFGTFGIWEATLRNFTKLHFTISACHPGAQFQFGWSQRESHHGPWLSKLLTIGDHGRHVSDVIEGPYFSLKNKSQSWRSGASSQKRRALGSVTWCYMSHV